LKIENHLRCLKKIADLFGARLTINSLGDTFFGDRF